MNENDDNLTPDADGPDVAPEAAGTALERTLPSTGADQTGAEFYAQACVFLRMREGKIECLVQYEGDQFVENPANPQGDGIPDMSNAAVHFARWVEIHMPALAQLSLGEYHLNKKLVTVVAVKKRPTLKLVNADGSKLNH